MKMDCAVIEEMRVLGRLALATTWVENRADVPGQPEHICHLAEAGGRPELALAPAGRVKLEGEWACGSL